MFGSVFSDYSNKNNNRIDNNIIEHKKLNAVPFFAFRNSDNYEKVNEEKNISKQNVFELKSRDLVKNQPSNSPVLVKHLSPSLPGVIKNQPSNPPVVVKNESSRKVVRMTNNETKIIPQRGKCRFSCLYPVDHISDERLDIYYPYFIKEENKKLDSFRSVLKSEISQYNGFKESLKKRQNPVGFSKYQTSIEKIEKTSKSTKLKIDGLNKKNVIVKKFKGNEEVSTIYTKDNRNHSFIHSFIAKYPLASDPFDVTCIFVMMLILSY